MTSYDSFSQLDGIVLKIPHRILDLVILNCKLAEENYQFSHLHNSYEMYLVLEGSFSLFIGDKLHELQEGDICWICPGVQHADHYKANQYHKQAIFTFDFVPVNCSSQNNDSLETKELKAILKQANAKKFWIGKDIRNCRHIFEMICEELERCEVGSYLNVSHLVSNLIFSSIQCMQLTPPGYRHPLKEAHVNNKVRQITLYLEEHYSENVTLEMAAKDLNITSRHINRLLNEQFGTTFRQMLVTTRLTFAKMYMLNTNYSVEKITELVGFSASRMLYKYFKEIEGITITEFRQKQNK